MEKPLFTAETPEADRLSDWAAAPHERAPTLEELESRIFAVHVTPIFPETGRLIAGARNRDEPACFRPTLHFALGSVVPDHGYSSHEGDPYAVIAPLGTLKRQLINISMHDTFVLGDVELADSMTLLVPEDTDTTKFNGSAQIVAYSREEGLSAAAQRLIEERSGWHTVMLDGSVKASDRAAIDGEDVNNPKFFSALLAEWPEVSFGSHVESIHGDAYRFGCVEQMLDLVMKSYFNHRSRFSTAKVELAKAYIEYQMTRLDAYVGSRDFGQQVYGVYKDKKKRLADWMTVIDCDLRLRHDLGKTFSGVDRATTDTISSLRNDPPGLQVWAESCAQDLPDADRAQDNDLTWLCSDGCSMPPDELSAFLDNHKSLLRGINMFEFYAQYAVQRWLIVGGHVAEQEGLTDVLDVCTPLIPKKDGSERDQNVIFGRLCTELRNDSSRFATALSLLSLPAIQNHLAMAIDLRFSSTPQTLDDVLRAHPDTHVLFEDADIDASPDEEAVLNTIGRIWKLENPLQAYRDFGDALREARLKKAAIYYKRQELATVREPMNTARDPQSLIPGDLMSLYECWHAYDVPAEEIWAKLGLGAEFRKLFPNDNDFWNSTQSLVDIYRKLITLENR